MAESNGSVGEALAGALDVLGGRSARLDAEVLLAHVLEVSRTSLFAHPERPLSPTEHVRFARLAARRGGGEPLAYLVGAREFWSLELEVSPATLIPRPETEHLVERALAALSGLERPRVADLGTGSGAVALALARERPDADLLGTDLSRDALALAARNAARHRLGNVSFCQTRWLAGIGCGRLAAVVANPPYVAADDPRLEVPPLAFEPRDALAAGADGLAAIRAIIAQSATALVAGGILLLEHGAAQGPAVRGLLAGSGFGQLATLRDHAGHERVSEGRLRGKIDYSVR